MTATQPAAVTSATAPFDRVGQVAVSCGLALLGAIGFAASYETLLQLAVRAGGFSPWLAPVVPLSFDLGVVVLSLKALMAARDGRSGRPLRGLVLLLSATSVAANASAATGVVGVLVHAVPPTMFVVCLESVVGDALRRACPEDRTGLPRPHPIVWLLAPASTWRTWRHDSLELLAARHGHHGLRTSHPDPKRNPAAPDALPHVAEPLTTVPAAPQDRVDAAVTLLRQDPSLTAVTLADLLRTRGHQLSVRTAQRVRAQSLARLERTIADEAA